MVMVSRASLPAGYRLTWHVARRASTQQEPERSRPQVNRCAATARLLTTPRRAASWRPSSAESPIDFGSSSSASPARSSGPATGSSATSTRRGCCPGGVRDRLSRAGDVARRRHVRGVALADRDPDRGAPCLPAPLRRLDRPAAGPATRTARTARRGRRGRPGGGVRGSPDPAHLAVRAERAAAIRTAVAGLDEPIGKSSSCASSPRCRSRRSPPERSSARDRQDAPSPRPAAPAPQPRGGGGVLMGERWTPPGRFGRDELAGTEGAGESAEPCAPRASSSGWPPRTTSTRPPGSWIGSWRRSPASRRRDRDGRGVGGAPRHHRRCARRTRRPLAGGMDRRAAPGGTSACHGPRSCRPCRQRGSRGARGRRPGRARRPGAGDRLAGTGPEPDVLADRGALAVAQPAPVAQPEPVGLAGGDRNAGHRRDRGPDDGRRLDAAGDGADDAQADADTEAHRDPRRGRDAHPSGDTGAPRDSPRRLTSTGRGGHRRHDARLLLR